MPNQFVDIVFAGIPWVGGGAPLMAPGLLKSIVQLEGYSAVGIDLNSEIVNRVIETFDDIEEALHVANFIAQRRSPNLEYYNNHSKFFHEQITYMAERILSYNPSHIGLSLLSVDSQFCTEYLALRLRQLAPNKKIVIGGPGITPSLGSKENTYAEGLLERGLIDCYLNSRGKEGILEYLKGNLKQSDNVIEYNLSNTDLDLPYPNYEDYDFDQYLIKALPILESEGCVQKCEFCDLIEYWPKYKFKKSSEFFDEMLRQSQTYGIRHFDIRNSLTNGNMTEFKKWLTLVANYNEKNPDKQFFWSGYFIIRPGKFHPEEMFELIKETNGQLIVGVETPVERIRIEMGKKFTNKDMDHHFYMSRKYNIENLLLLMSANPGETQEDYKFVEEWLNDQQPYIGTAISRIDVQVAVILPNTTWDRKRNDNEWAVRIGDNTFEQPGINNFESRMEHAQKISILANKFNSLVESSFYTFGTDNQ